MQPIVPRFIHHSLHSGRRCDLSTYLLVERIDFVAPDAVMIGGRRHRAGESIETLQSRPGTAVS